MKKKYIATASKERPLTPSEAILKHLSKLPEKDQYLALGFAAALRSQQSNQSA
nr:MAG TPA: hypothetical protein [Caudoviricetes sp.]